MEQDARWSEGLLGVSRQDGSLEDAFCKVDEENERGSESLKSKPELGSGKRYEMLISSLRAKGAEDPRALAAWIGRKKYGKAKFQSLAARGRKAA